MRPRYQARMVSGLATQATFSRALRPSRFPISASVHRSGSDRRSRGQAPPENSVLRRQVLVLEEQFLVHQPRYIRQ